MSSHYIVEPVPGVSGAVRVPGDKSVSHRSLMLGSIADGVTEVSGFLESEDCLSTMKAMRALGVKIEQTGPQAVRVHGVGMRGLKPANHALDMGNSGTSMRLMTGLLSGQSFDSELIGDSSLMKRPMERAAKPLREMGAQIATLDGKPPVKITGGAQAEGHSLRAAGGQRAGEIRRAARGFVCKHADDGHRACDHARSYRAHVAELRLPGRRRARRSVARRRRRN